MNNCSRSRTFLWLCLLVCQAFMTTRAAAQTPQGAARVETAEASSSVTLISATAYHQTVTAGGLQKLRATVRSNTVLQNAIAQIRIYDSARSQVAIKYFDSINLAAGVDTTLEFLWFSSSTQAPGNYTVEVGVWTSTWNTLLYAMGLAPFSIVARPAVSLVSATVSQASIPRGQTQVVNATIQSPTHLTNLIVDIRIYNAAGERVGRREFGSVALSAGVPATLRYDYQVPSDAAVGSYTVHVGVWDTTWATLLYEMGLAPFSITSGSPSPTPPPPVLATLRNLVLNPGFEYDWAGYNRDGWTNWEIDTTQPRTGQKALRIKPDGGFGTLILMNQLIPGQSYRATVHAKVGNPSETAFWGVTIQNAAGAQIFGQNVYITSTAYQAYTLDFTVPLEARNASLFFYKHQGTTSIYADDLEVVQTSNVPPLRYAQPSATPPGGIAYPFGSRLVGYVAGIRPTHVSNAAQDQAIKELYDDWKALLSTRCGGYMVEFNPPGRYAAVSEGIGYGMMMTAIMAGHDPQAKELFDGLFRFARMHPAYGQDPNLMDWAVAPDCSSGGGGWSATDGDLDIAMGLLLADKQWGSAGEINYMAEAVKTINALKLVHFQSNGFAGGRYHRTSDNIISHFRAFKRATGDEFWDLAIAKAFEMLALGQSFSSVGLIPGWLVGFHEGNVRPSPGGVIEGPLEGDFDWNANRIPWRLATDYAISGDLRSRNITLNIMNFLRSASGGSPAQIAAGYRLDGTVLWQFPSLSFVGPATAGALVDANNQGFMNDLWAYTSSQPIGGYYDNELQLLGLIVASGNWWQP